MTYLAAGMRALRTLKGVLLARFSTYPTSPLLDLHGHTIKQERWQVDVLPHLCLPRKFEIDPWAISCRSLAQQSTPFVPPVAPRWITVLVPLVLVDVS